MDHNHQSPNKDLPSDDKEIREKGEQAKKEMDRIPPPGTDPLHEGP